jgi:hypothetical protein
MHLNQSTLLVAFICESNVKVSVRLYISVAAVDTPHKSITPGNTRYGVEHDLCTLAAEEWPDELGLAVISEAEDRVAENGDEV